MNGAAVTARTRRGSWSKLEISPGEERPSQRSDPTWPMRLAQGRWTRAMPRLDPCASLGTLLKIRISRSCFSPYLPGPTYSSKALWPRS